MIKIILLRYTGLEARRKPLERLIFTSREDRFVSCLLLSYHNNRVGTNAANASKQGASSIGSLTSSIRLTNGADDDAIHGRL